MCHAFRWALLLVSSVSGSSECEVGVGLSLEFQKNKLAVDVAAGRIRGMGMKCVRLWHYDQSYLQALLDVGIQDVLVNVPIPELSLLASGMSHARKVAGILKPFHDQGMRFRVAIGNEPLAPWEEGRHTAHLVPSLKNMRDALQENGLGDVTTTVPFYNGILSVSYPPQLGTFRGDILATISEVARFIHDTGGEFVVQLYPAFVVMENSDVSLDLALGKRNNTVDGITYSGLLHQQIAATRAALTRLNPAYAEMPLTIGESGWPSAGHQLATVENAGAFVSHVLSAASMMDPHLRTIYLFEAFDEKLKSQFHGNGPNPEIEDNFGLMSEDGTHKFTFLWDDPLDPINIGTTVGASGCRAISTVSALLVGAFWRSASIS